MPLVRFSDVQLGEMFQANITEDEGTAAAFIKTKADILLNKSHINCVCLSGPYKGKLMFVPPDEAVVTK